MNHLQSSQGEADKTATLHYIDATLNGASHLHIHSPVTDVFVLALNTSFITGTGSKRRGIHLASFYAALGKEKQNALPDFHAFSSADQTGRFAGKGKPTCWKVFSKASSDIIAAFAAFGATEVLLDAVYCCVVKWVCQL